MKTQFFFALIALFLFGVGGLQAQTSNTKTKKEKVTIKRIKVESNLSKKSLTLYGVLDSTTFRIMGIANKGWTTNVKCFKRKSVKEKWYTDKHYKYFYKGMDTSYIWWVIFFNDGSIRVKQNKKGVGAPVDIYGGDYEMPTLSDTNDKKDKT